MIALRMILFFTLLTGILYPLFLTGLAQTLFPYAANGSLLTQDGQVIGSALLGQQVDDPRLFWSRLSATSPAPYNPASSSGSNLGPRNPALQTALKARAAALRAADPTQQLPIPIDLLTASGSGLDPHLSPAAAAYQIPRVARLRGLPLAQVEACVARHTEPRQLGVLGQLVVNVRLLNRCLTPGT